MTDYHFRQAVPVWEKGKTKKMNYNLVFRTIAPKCTDATIALSASGVYQMFINGNMVSQGPARAGHGFFRVDEIDISTHLTCEQNIVAIYVNSCYVDNYYLIKQPGFFCAEIISDGQVIAATGKHGFSATYHHHRVRETNRFSCQRTFCEVYEYDENYKSFETDIDYAFTPVNLVLVKNKKFITRDVPYPCYDYFAADRIVSSGKFTYSEPDTKNERKWISRADTIAGYGFGNKEAKCITDNEINSYKYIAASDISKPFSKTSIDGYEWMLFDFGSEKTGFVNLEITVSEDAEIMLSFDEILTDGDVDIKRFNTSGAIILFMKPGSYKFTSNEPYSMRFIKIANKSEGAVVISAIGITEFAFNYKPKPLNSKDEKLNLIYNAATETFRQNTVDIFMDCPSRERAGWLCDSFFTVQTEYHFTGENAVERNFLENFLMPKSFKNIPEGMFPMCYPADFFSGLFIPNWAMWLIIELGEYYKRTGDRKLVDAFYDKAVALYNYFKRFYNDDGLLENLDGWIVIDWSEANNYTQGVSYPTNMLYSKMLRTMGELYDKKFLYEAEEIKSTILAQSFMHGFFHDYALRQGDILVTQTPMSEVCQYYAFFTEIASVQTHKILWEILVHDFGSGERAHHQYSNMPPANVFIGCILRLLLLEKYGRIDVLLRDIKGYFLHMAETTHTLWENLTPHASCNHGFASIIAMWLDKYARKKEEGIKK